MFQRPDSHGPLARMLRSAYIHHANWEHPMKLEILSCFLFARRTTANKMISWRAQLILCILRSAAHPPSNNPNPRDPSTFSEGTWTLQTLSPITLSIPYEKVLGSLGQWRSLGPSSAF